MENVFHHFTNKYFRFEYIYRKFDALDTFIQFKMGSDNVLGKHIRHFDWMEVVCLVSLIHSIGSMRLYLSYVPRDSIAK